MTKQDQRNYSVLAVFVVGAGYFLYSYLSVPDTHPAVQQTAVTAPNSQRANVPGPAGKTKSATPLDPTLHMEAMLVTESLVYSGNGRNIFSAGPGPRQLVLSIVKPIEIPVPITPVRTSTAQSVYGPPPIDLKFFGTEVVTGGARRAFLLHGEDVFLVSAGEIVQRRYRVIRIDPRAIVMEDIANNDQQTLPLLTN